MTSPPTLPAASVPKPVVREGYTFNESLKTENEANAEFEPLLLSHFGKQFRKAYSDEQAAGKDFVISKGGCPVSFEMKSEVYAFNAFFEFIQLIQSSKKYDFGGVQKTTANYYLLVNFPGRYALVAHRETLAHLAIKFTLDDLFYERRKFSAVLNENWSTGKLTRCAYGMPLPLRELLDAYMETGRPYRVLDLGRTYSMERVARIIAGAKLKTDVNAWKSAKVRATLEQGIVDRRAIQRQLVEVGRTIEPLDTFPDFIRTLEGERDSALVRSSGPALIRHAALHSRTRNSSKIALEIKGTYEAKSPEVAACYGANFFDFSPPEMPSSGVSR